LTKDIRLSGINFGSPKLNSLSFGEGWGEVTDSELIIIYYKNHHLLNLAFAKASLTTTLNHTTQTN
jgi:hypothetical protein